MTTTRRARERWIKSTDLNEQIGNAAGVVYLFGFVAAMSDQNWSRRVRSKFDLRIILTVELTIGFEMKCYAHHVHNQMAAMAHRVCLRRGESRTSIYITRDIR